MVPFARVVLPFAPVPFAREVVDRPFPRVVVPFARVGVGFSVTSGRYMMSRPPMRLRRSRRSLGRQGGKCGGHQAIGVERQFERSYYQGMAELLAVDARTERISSRELYRRCARIGDEVIDVAERIIYAVVKESCVPLPSIWSHEEQCHDSRADGRAATGGPSLDRERAHG